MIYSILAKYLLTKADQVKIVENSQKKAIKLWNNLGSKIVWINSGISKHIKSLEEFKKTVPVITKETVFEKNSLEELTSSKIQKLSFVMMSSGSSSKFSLGVLTKKEMKNAAFNTDLFLHLFFKAHKNKTLIINSSSMGVKVFTHHVISDTGPRSDIVIGLLKTVAPYYEKIFIIGDPIFIKLMVEDSIEEGINWNALNAFFISGGEWLPETLRNYIHNITEKSPLKPEKGFWIGTYGLTELGYPLFFETAELVAYRSDLSQYNKPIPAHSNTNMRCTTPFIFYYRASSYYLETINTKNGHSRLVFTTLDKNRLIPLFRYDTGDVGELIDHGQIQIKNQAMPLVQFWGRDNNFIVINNSKIHISDIKEMLFSIPEIIDLITGFFTISKAISNVLLIVQLKKNKTISPNQKQALIDQINKYYPFVIDLKFADYRDMKYQMELDFERKFNPLI